MLASVQDFVDTYGQREAINLTNLDDADTQSIQPSVLESALKDASNYLNMYVRIDHPLYKNWHLTVTRYNLDVNLRRDEVTADFQQVQTQIQSQGGIYFAQESLPVYQHNRPLY